MTGSDVGGPSPGPGRRGSLTPGQRVVLVAADLLRLGALASLGWAVTGGEWVNAALFALVVGGMVLPRLLAARPALDLVVGVAVLFAAWSAVLDLYVRFAWLDVAVHAVTCGLVTVTVLRLLVTCSVLPSPGDRVVVRARAGAVLTTVTLGLALGVAWEAGEWAGHTYLDRRIQVGYDDTMGDLGADGLGALVAGLLLSRGGRRWSR